MKLEMFVAEVRERESWVRIKVGTVPCTVITTINGENKWDFRENPVVGAGMTQATPPNLIDPAAAFNNRNFGPIDLLFSFFSLFRYLLSSSVCMYGEYGVLL